MADKVVDLGERRWARDEGVADTEACLDLAAEVAVRAGITLRDFTDQARSLWCDWTLKVRREREGETR